MIFTFVQENNIAFDRNTSFEVFSNNLKNGEGFRNIDNQDLEIIHEQLIKKYEIKYFDEDEKKKKKNKKLMSSFKKILKKSKLVKKDTKWDSVIINY